MNDRHKHNDVEMIDFTYILINYSSKVVSTGQDLSYLPMVKHIVQQWRRHSSAWQGVCPARNVSALPAALSAALAVKALIIRLFIKCKIMALWLTELR